MTLKACILAEQSVPRYTSYPTAPHFTAAVGSDIYADWLRALPTDATLSLYLHVPYCARLCLYCGCHTKIVRRRDPIEAYADVLGKEIERVAALTGRRKVSSIHWGGGTPSMLGACRLAELAGRIAAGFDLSDISEHAIEIDPRQCDPEFVRAIAAIGVNRASLGVQEFSGQVQEAIGRVQPFGQVAAAVAALRAAGISALNFDLMYGLPQGFVQNASGIAGYTRAIEAGELATAKGKALSPDDKLRGRIIERLMCDFAVDLDDCAGNERFGAAFAALAPLAHDGLVTIDRQRITVTQAGSVRLAASAFDAYLASGTGRHSHAV